MPLLTFALGTARLYVGYGGNFFLTAFDTNTVTLVKKKQNRSRDYLPQILKLYRLIILYIYFK